MANNTTTWVEKDKKQLHPVHHPKTHANPLVVERGEGVWLYTTDGQKILDGMAGLWNVKPDILSFAKAITSGYAQLGGIQLSDEIRETMESAADTEAWMHGYTYSGHAMACAVGLKNLELMEREEFPKRAKELGKRLLEGFDFIGNKFLSREFSRNSRQNVFVSLIPIKSIGITYRIFFRRRCARTWLGMRR